MQAWVVHAGADGGAADAMADATAASALDSRAAALARNELAPGFGVVPAAPLAQPDRARAATARTDASLAFTVNLPERVPLPRSW